MTQEEIIQGVLEFLKFISEGASMTQEPYHSDIFRLFKETYQNGYFEHSSSPLLTGDALHEILITRWFTEDEAENERKAALIRRLTTKWNDWRYAWDKYEN